MAKVAMKEGILYLVLINPLNRPIQAPTSKAINIAIHTAEFLLLHSSLAIKSIAQAVGIPDINHFNKTIRKELGAAPSKIRELSGNPRRSDGY